MKTIQLIISLLVLFHIEAIAQWVQTASTPQGGGVTDMVVLNDGTLIVTTASYNWPNGQPGGIRRSTDGGNSWQNINNVYNARTLWLGSTGKLFASCWPYPGFESAYYSSNNGTSWNLMLSLGANDNVFSIASKNGDSTVFLGTRNGILRTTNNGNSFINSSSGIPQNSWVRDLAIVNNYVFAATTNGLFKSTNNGSSWYAIGGLVQGDTAVKLEFVNNSANDNGEDDFFFVGTSNGRLYLDTEEPYETFDISYFLYGYEISGITGNGTFYVMTLFPRGGGASLIVYSIDGGDTWEPFPLMGLPIDLKVSAINWNTYGSYDNPANYILHIGAFMNTSNGAGIFKYSSVIGITPVKNNVPNSYLLYQNYPNPFNPTTNIEFAIPKSSFVRLIVYDMVGREVETLVNEDLKPGIYKTNWSASKYSSGIYFYKIICSGYTNTKKMILIK